MSRGPSSQKKKARKNDQARKTEKSRKNSKASLQRAIRRLQVDAHEEFIQRQLVRDQSIYLICFILSMLIAVGACVFILFYISQNVLVLAVTIVNCAVFAPFCWINHSRLRAAALEVIAARKTNGFRFPEDYTDNTKHQRSRVNRTAKEFARSSVLFGVLTIVLGFSAFYLSQSGNMAANDTSTIVVVIILILIAFIMFVMFFMNTMSLLDARKLRALYVQIAEEQQRLAKEGKPVGSKKVEVVDDDDDDEEEDDDDDDDIDDDEEDEDDD